MPQREAEQLPVMTATPGTTDYVEIQENEVQVLQSIFMEDFVEEKTKAAAWNVG